MNTYSPPRILLGLTLDELTELAAYYGLRPFAARQMARWLYEKRVTSVAEMTDLPAAVRRRMEEELEVGRYAPKAEALPSDFSTFGLYMSGNLSRYFFNPYKPGFNLTKFESR